MKSRSLLGFSDLKRIYDRCCEYVQFVEAGEWMTDGRHVSAFWASQFRDAKRINYPDFNTLQVMRRGATYPLADSPGGQDPARERRLAEAAYAVVSQSVPAEYLASVDESPVGCPWSFEINEQMLSAGGIINALTVYRILDRCRQRRFARTKLHVLEIGAGYGHVAEQLLRRLPIERYVICDLPQNLFLSSFYLQANSPEREVRFIRPGEPEDSSGQLTFLVPPFLSEVTGRFDLVINSYSFQEMSRASVDEYFAFVRSALNAEGLLYSLNAHGKSEVEWPSDYPIDGFRLLSIRPVRKFPHHWVFATNPYEMVLAPDESIASVRSEAFNLHLDALGGGFQLGLDEELAGVATRLAAQTLGTLEAEWLSRFGAFLRRRDVAGKCSEIERMKAGEILPHVTGYLGGRLAFTLGQRDEARRYLEAAVEGLSRTHARAISSLMLGWLDLTVHDWTSANRRVADAVNLVPHLRDEIEEWVMNPDLPAAAAHQLRLHDESSRPSDIFSRLRRRGAKFVTRSAR